MSLFPKRQPSEVPPAKPEHAPVFWPGDLLAVDKDLSNVRLLTFGYNSDVLRIFGATGRNNISQHAKNLVGDLLGEREGTARPIIFVCHSLGGIIVKEALRLSSVAQFRPREQRLYQDTFGIVFLGTPHRGSSWASWGSLCSNLAKLALQSTTSTLLQQIQVDSAVLQIIAHNFSNMIRDDIKIHSFREERGMSGLYGFDAKVA